MNKKKRFAPVKGRARTSMRIKLQKLVAARKRRNQPESPVPISRTVEMVDQQREDWRSETSQLIFMTAIGLTPKADWQENVPLSLNVEENYANKTKTSSTSTKETKAGVEVDDECVCLESEDDCVWLETKNDDCVCVGVFKYTPIKWCANIPSNRYNDSTMYRSYNTKRRKR